MYAASCSPVGWDGRTLFSYLREPSPTVVIVDADNGSVLATFPTGEGADTVAFNPATMEAIS